jgi:hypothetical protein
MVSTGLSGARRFQSALALHPFPASKVQCGPLEFPDIDTHNTALTFGSLSSSIVSR